MTTAKDSKPGREAPPKPGSGAARRSVIVSLGIQGSCEYGKAISGNLEGLLFYRWPGEPDSAWRAVAR